MWIWRREYEWIIQCGRSGFGPFEILEEPGPAARGCNRGELPGGGLSQPKVKRLLLSESFSVDGTLLEARASIRSFRRKGESDNDASGCGVRSVPQT